MAPVLVLQPERLIEKYNLKSLAVDGEKRKPHEPEELLAGDNVLDFVANERLPFFGFGFRVQPIADVKQRDGGKNGDEALHAFAVVPTQGQNRLSREPSQAAGDEGEYPA